MSTKLARLISLIIFVVVFAGGAAAQSPMRQKSQGSAHGQAVYGNAAASQLAAMLHGPELKDLVYEEITAKLPGIVNNEQRFRTQITSYSALARYYEKNIQDLKGLFPAAAFALDFKKVFSSFSGKPGFSVPEAFMFPVMPISFLVHEDESVRFFKMKGEIGGQEVFGLKVSCHLGQAYAASTTRSAFSLVMDLGYLPTVNARAMGFGYAQLIPSLSENVRPAGKFYYNGFMDWSQHSHAKEDQVTSPIELTNFAHTIRNNLYVISVYPDFALELRNIAERHAKMTFFLWRESSDASTEKPEFLYQIEILAPRK